MSDVELEEPSLELPNGGRSSPPPKAKPASGEDHKMDYLTVGLDGKTNVDQNQITVTSTASGNLALYYEVRSYCEVRWGRAVPSTWPCW